MQENNPKKSAMHEKSRVEAGKLKTFALKKGHPKNSRELKMPRKREKRTKQVVSSSCVVKDHGRNGANVKMTVPKSRRSRR